jgi:hypothetical protein
MRSTHFLGAAVSCALALSLSACGSCQPDKVPEPTASARSAPPVASAPSPTEQRERGIGLQPELCSQAARHFNELNGREPFDKKGTNIIAFCLRYGSVAWYRCVSDATTPDAAKECMRLLGPAE